MSKKVVLLGLTACEVMAASLATVFINKENTQAFAGENTPSANTATIDKDNRLVAYGMSFVRRQKKLAICGTFAILAFVIIYHGIFNALVQSEYKYVGIALPIVTYIPFIIRQIIRYKRRKKSQEAE